MSLTFGFYRDAERSQPLASLSLAGGTVTRIWVGTDGSKVAMTPNGEDITLTAQAIGPGLPASQIRLANSLSELAHGDASVAIGQVVSGMQALWLQVEDAGLDDGQYANLSLVSNAIYEV